MSESLSTSAMH